jgi:O-antigen/teichoic acid export membrane protein
MTDVPDAAAVAATAVERPASGRFRRLARDSVLYASGAVVGKALGLVMLPVLTRALTPEEFGRFDVLSTLSSALITMLLLGTDVAAIRLYFDRRTPRDRAELLTSWYALTAVITLAVAFILIVARSWISLELFGTVELEGAVAIVGLVVVAGTFQVLVLGALRARGSSGPYGLLSSMALVLNAVLTIGFLVFWRPDASAVLAALAVSWTSSALIGFAIVRRDLHGRPSVAIARRLLALGLPLAPAVALVWAADFFQRVILLNAASPQDVAYFAVAIRFGSVATLMVYGFQYAWQPRTFAAEPGAARRGELGDARWILTTVAVGAGAIGLFTRPLIHLAAGEAYGPAVPTTGLALVGAIALAAFMIHCTPLLVGRRTARVAIATFVGTVSALALNVILAPTLAANGTAAAIAAGQLVAAGAAWMMTPADERIHGLGKAIPAVFASMALIVAGTMLEQSVAVPVIIAAGFAMALVLTLDGSLSVGARFVKGLIARAGGRSAG